MFVGACAGFFTGGGGGSRRCGPSEVFVLNNKNMTVNRSMSCHNITAFRIHPTLCFPVLRNTKSAGFLICKTCLLCIFMSKSSSNTMGFQLFDVLFIKVGGPRPVTGLTVL